MRALDRRSAAVVRACSRSCSPQESTTYVSTHRVGLDTSRYRPHSSAPSRRRRCSSARMIRLNARALASGTLYSMMTRTGPSSSWRSRIEPRRRPLDRGGHVLFHDVERRTLARPEARGSGARGHEPRASHPVARGDLAPHYAAEREPPLEDQHVDRQDARRTQDAVAT